MSIMTTVNDIVHFTIKMHRQWMRNTSQQRRIVQFTFDRRDSPDCMSTWKAHVWCIRAPGTAERLLHLPIIRHQSPHSRVCDVLDVLAEMPGILRLMTHSVRLFCGGAHVRNPCRLTCTHHGQL